jgi:hypothetical protein
VEFIQWDEMERTSAVANCSCIRTPCHIPDNWSTLAFHHTATIRHDMSGKPGQ